MLLRNLRQEYALFFLRGGDAVITFSELGREYLLARGFDRKKVICAPNTLDTDRHRNLAKQSFRKFSHNELASSLSLPTDARFILFMGRLMKSKRADHLIRAIPIIQKVIPQIHLIIIGDGKERNDLVGLAESLVPERVTFVGGVFDDFLKAKYFTLSELFVLPGYVGLAIVYAFCYGLPVITERINFHAPEIQYLRQGQSGYIVDDGDINELAQKAIDLLTNPGKLKAFSDNAIKTIECEANIGLMIERMGTALSLEHKKLSYEKSKPVAV